MGADNPEEAEKLQDGFESKTQRRWIFKKQADPGI
jgi:hypothetical protein